MNPFSGSNGLLLLPHRANGAQHDRPLTPGKERKKDRMATVLLFASKQHTHSNWGGAICKSKKSDFKNDLEEHSTDHLQRLCLRYDLSTLQGIEIIYTWKMELITYTL